MQPKPRHHIVFDTSDSDSNVGQTAGEPVAAQQSGEVVKDDHDSDDVSRRSSVQGQPTSVTVTCRPFALPGRRLA